jgi:hypothetical protein
VAVKDSVFDLEDADLSNSDSDTEAKSESTSNDHQATKSSESITVSTTAKESVAKFGRTQVLEAGKQTTAESRSVGGVSKNVYWVRASWISLQQMADTGIDCLLVAAAAAAAVVVTVLKISIMVVLLAAVAHCLSSFCFTPRCLA